MNLTDQDIKDLRSAIRVESPAFYKDGYRLAHSSRGVVNFLRRNGVSVEVDTYDTGRITVERKDSE